MKHTKKELGRLVAAISGFLIINYVGAMLTLWYSGANYTYAERKIFSAAFMVFTNLTMVIFVMVSTLTKRIKRLETQLGIDENKDKEL